MANPFRLRWLEGWTFQTVLMEGAVQVEARGFGICLRTMVQPGETPRTAADRLVLEEDRRRRALHNAWLRGQTMPERSELDRLPGAQQDLPSPAPSASESSADGELIATAAMDGENVEPVAADNDTTSEASNIVRSRESQFSRSLN
jgi:hypothetical protein